MAGINIQQAAIPFIPIAEGIEQSNGCNSGKGNRQDNLKEDDNIVCPIQLGGLGKGGRNSVEKVPHQDNVPCVADGRKYQDPDGVFQMEGFGDQKVAGNQTAVKEHGKVDKQRQRRTAAEALQAQGEDMAQKIREILMDMMDDRKRRAMA